MKLELVMVEGSSYSRAHLKRRLFAEGIKERRCETCGQGENWLGGHMALILDHINGVPDDHRLENLRVLCPNCAATLDTHCGRKNKGGPLQQRSCLRCGKQFLPRSRTARYCSRGCGIRWDRNGVERPGARKVDRPAHEQLLGEIEATNYCAVGRKYGVSDNAVRKWVRAYEREAARKESEGRLTDRPSGPTISPVSAATVLIMAAGQGTRMRSAVPKVLHPICGRALVSWPILAAQEAGAGRIAVITSADRDISGALPERVESIHQPEADGTGGAIRSALSLIEESETVLVLSGDVPLVSAELIAAALETHERESAAATVVTAILADPGSYGRVVRSPDGATVERIVEAKAAGDATPEELAIDEINAGIYAFDAPALAAALPRLGNDNAQGEYYLPDVLPLLAAAGGRVVPHVSGDPNVILGVNSRADLAVVEAEARRQILNRHMLAGVTLVDPGATWIEAEVEIAPDTRIEPGCSLIGETRVGSGSVVGPHTTLIDSRLGDAVTVPHSYLVECDVADRCVVGPFAYLRPRAELGEGAKAGAFVEIKNSRIGAGSKVPHLSYIGDAEVGEDANLGAATITANYDGFTKSRTKIGHGARTGVDTTLIAPVEIGDSAYTGAGSVISEDVSAGALAMTRPEQVEIEGYAERRARRSQRASDASDPEEKGGEVGK